MSESSDRMDAPASSGLRTLHTVCPSTWTQPASLDLRGVTLDKLRSELRSIQLTDNFPPCTASFKNEGRFGQDGSLVSEDEIANPIRLEHGSASRPWGQGMVHEGTCQLDTDGACTLEEQSMLMNYNLRFDLRDLNIKLGQGGHDTNDPRPRPTSQQPIPSRGLLSLWKDTWIGNAGEMDLDQELQTCALGYVSKAGDFASALYSLGYHDALLFPHTQEEKFEKRQRKRLEAPGAEHGPVDNAQPDVSDEQREAETMLAQLLTRAETSNQDDWDVVAAADKSAPDPNNASDSDAEDAHADLIERVFGPKRVVLFHPNGIKTMANGFESPFAAYTQWVVSLCVPRAAQDGRFFLPEETDREDVTFYPVA